MRGLQHHRGTDGLVIVELVDLLVDRSAGVRINQGRTLVQQGGELGLQIIGQALAAAVGADRIGLVPVVRVMDIFLPTGGHDRDLMGALGGQVSRPGQAEDLDIELRVDLGQVGSQNFSHGLAGGIALVVKHLHAETDIPDRLAIGRLERGGLERSGGLVKIHCIVRRVGIVAGHARERDFQRLDCFTLVNIVDIGVPVESIAEALADINIRKEIRGNAIAIQLAGANIWIRCSGGGSSRRGGSRRGGSGRGSRRRGSVAVAGAAVVAGRRRPRAACSRPSKSLQQLTTYA